MSADARPSPPVVYVGETPVPASCPVCGALAAGSLGDWDSFNRHVNACIDRSDRTAAAAAPAGAAGEDGDDREEPEEAFDGEEITRWLADMGLERYAHAFVREEIDLAALPFVTDADLQHSVGVEDAGAREDILRRALMMRLFSGERDDLGDGEDDGDKENEGSVGGEGKTKPPAASLRPWERMPLGLVVDCFAKHARAAASAFVLTHFDAERYRGLSKSFRGGPVYCSAITRDLCAKCLGVPPTAMRALPLGVTHAVPECGHLRVTFVDANHVPGAVMVVIEPPAESPRGFAPILHTGHFRFDASMRADAHIERLRRARCQLILDTTHRSPEVVLPERDALVDFIASAVQAESFNPRTLFLIAADGVGMERIYIAVARRLGKLVYCGKAKREALSCLPLRAEDAARVTSNDTATNLHVVSASQVGWKRMKSILAYYRGKYSTVVGFRPADCLAKRNRGRVCRGKKTLVMYEVPHSDHSSFEGLREAVGLLRPSRIVPTDDAERARETVARLVDGVSW